MPIHAQSRSELGKLSKVYPTTAKFSATPNIIFTESVLGSVIASIRFLYTIMGLRLSGGSGLVAQDRLVRELGVFVIRVFPIVSVRLVNDHTII